MYTLGATEGETILNQDLVPFLSKPVFLRLVSNKKLAANYAAGGFHVSVTRGKVGGCADRATGSFLSLSALCRKELNDPAIRAAWTVAAGLYLGAFKNAQIPQVSLAAIKAQLNAANGAADKAYHLEGVDPPRDPLLTAMLANGEAPLDPAGAAPGVGGFVSQNMGMIGLAGLGGFLLVQSRKAKKGRKKSKRKTTKRRPPQRRRRSRRRGR